MAVTKPRTKLLMFRLTQDEYASLQAASSGARSLSDYARSKLLDAAEPRRIDVELIELKTTVARLANLLERT